MNINQIDIIIIFFIGIIISVGYNNGMIKNVCKTINLVTSSILSSFIIKNLSFQFSILNKTQDILYLSIFLLLLLILLFLIGIIIEFLTEQIENLIIDKYLQIVMNIVASAVKGFVMIALILFIFDTVPMSQDSRDVINGRMEKNSFLFKPCNNLKDILFNR